MHTLKILKAGGYVVNCAGMENQDACRSMLTNRQCPCQHNNNDEVKIKMNNALLPPDVKEEAPAINLQVLQASADEKGILLPAQYNRQAEPLVRKQDEEQELLLPCGLGG